MNWSEHCVNALVSIYKSINRTGLLDHPRTQSLFVSCYFIYKKYLEDAYAKLIKNYPHFFQEGHILDIGANIGYTSYIFSQALTSPYRIFAFEPEKRNVAILNKVAQSHRFVEKLTIVAAAVGDKEEEIEIWQNEGHHADHRVITEEFRKQLKSNAQIQKTSMITIDQFLTSCNALSPIAFIKIDVQGFELPVCLGMKRTLLANPNCIIGFEYSPSIMEALGYQAKELIHFFQNKNYFFYRLNKNGTFDQLNLNNLEQNNMSYFDILCSKRNLIPA